MQLLTHEFSNFLQLLMGVAATKHWTHRTAPSICITPPSPSVTAHWRLLGTGSKVARALTCLRNVCLYSAAGPILPVGSWADTHQCWTEPWSAECVFTGLITWMTLTGEETTAVVLARRFLWSIAAHFTFIDLRVPIGVMRVIAVCEWNFGASPNKIFPTNHIKYGSDH